MVSEENGPLESSTAEAPHGDHYIPELAEAPHGDHHIPELAESPSLSAREDTGSASGARRGCGIMVLVLAGAVVGVTALLGVFAWAFSATPTTVPNTVGLRQPEATLEITAAYLATGTVGDVPSADFQSGVVVSQYPVGDTQVPVGTPVNVAVAAPPASVQVPSVGLDYAEVAEATLVYARLRPVVYQQLSDTVPFGRVVAQMPRAGQQAITGQQVAVFVSLGPGIGGAVVPSVLGKSSSAAETDIAQVYLVPKWLDAAIGEKPGGTVVDQVPAPGTRVPVGSAVPIITTSMVN